MIVDPSERERLDAAIRQAGFNPDEFVLELVSVSDIVQPDKSYLPIKQYKVIRTTNGKSNTYYTGHGSVWPDDVKADLQAGKFGEP